MLGRARQNIYSREGRNFAKTKAELGAENKDPKGHIGSREQRSKRSHWEQGAKLQKAALGAGSKAPKGHIGSREQSDSSFESNFRTHVAGEEVEPITPREKRARAKTNFWGFYLKS